LELLSTKPSAAGLGAWGTNTFNELTEYVTELARTLQPNGALDRSGVFWLFFHAAKLRLGSSYVRGHFQELDIRVRTFIDGHQSDFIGDEKIRAQYLVSGVPRELLAAQFEELSLELNNRAAVAGQKVKGEVDRAEELVSRVAAAEKRASELATLLKDQGEKLNFIGLSHAFRNMAEETAGQLSSPVRWLLITAIVMLGVPICALVLPYLTRHLGYEWWQGSLPFVAIELVLFYLFRVLLLRYQSLKAQLLQIQLRYSLCAFVEGYSEFAARVRKSPDDKTLDKFEALIFSGITPDPQHVPSQFDGLEQLASTVRAVTGTKA
jgi:hypothetical protein